MQPPNKSGRIDLVRFHSYVQWAAACHKLNATMSSIISLDGSRMINDFLSTWSDCKNFYGPSGQHPPAAGPVYLSPPFRKSYDEHVDMMVCSGILDIFTKQCPKHSTRQKIYICFQLFYSIYNLDKFFVALNSQIT